MAATLSIVMPVFNHPEELRPMLNSILASTYQDWELLAIDDGSEQETLSVLEQYASRDERIHFIRREQMPKGAQTCRNMGLEQAKGEFVVFFDSDDYITPNGLQMRVKEIEAHPDLDFMVFRNGVFSENGFHTEPGKDIFGCPIFKDDIAAFCSRILPFVVWNNIYRREALLRHGIRWDTNLLSLQDLDFNIQTLLGGMRYAYSSCPPDYGYRTRRDGEGQSISKKMRTRAHQPSHLYALGKLYSMVTERYPHRYDRELYRGAQFILNILMEPGYDAEAANEVSHIVWSHSRMYGTCIWLQTRLIAFFSKILPPKRARQVVLAPFLIWRRKKVRQKISKLPT